MFLKSKRIFCQVCAIVLIISILAISTPVVTVDVADGPPRVTDPNIITQVTSPTNQYIFMYVDVPAYQKVEYSIQVRNSWNPRVYVPYSKKGKIENKTNKGYVKKVIVPVDYYSDNYSIVSKRSYCVGKNPSTATDYDTVKVRPVKTEFTEEFTWTKELLNKRSKNKTLSTLAWLAVSQATTLVLDVAITKGFASAWMAGINTSLGIGSKIANAVSIVPYASPENIMKTPMIGWGYVQKLVLDGKTGYSVYLLVYNDKGKLYNTYKMFSVKFNNGINNGIRTYD